MPTMNCRHCRIEISGADEDELVENVQARASTHSGGTPLSREHILSRLHRLQDRDPHGDPPSAGGTPDSL